MSEVVGEGHGRGDLRGGRKERIGIVIATLCIRCFLFLVRKYSLLGIVVVVVVVVLETRKIQKSDYSSIPEVATENQTQSKYISKKRNKEENATIAAQSNT